jgi:hypothetical protein
MTERKASATARAEEEADPYGMTARKASATARANEEADPCGMTARKANATAQKGKCNSKGRSNYRGPSAARCALRSG